MLDRTQETLFDENTTDFSDLKALTINCTLKPSPARPSASRRASRLSICSPRWVGIAVLCLAGVVRDAASARGESDTQVKLIGPSDGPRP